MVSFMASSAACNRNMLLPCTCQKLMFPFNITCKPYMPIRSCAHMRQLCQYICIIYAHWNQHCDQKHWCTYISHYWYMFLKKYSSHITEICPTALLLWSTYRLHITGHTNPKMHLLLTMLYPYVCYQQLCPSSATYIPHMPISSWADIR